MTKQLNPGPRKDFLDAHPEEKKVAVATVRKITTEFDAIAKRISQWIKEGIDLANNIVEIGTFYLELCDSLPGKKMTVDFWRQYAPMFVDKNGTQIKQDQLEWAAKIARANPDGFKEIGDVFGYRQQMLGVGGYELVGEAPGTTAHKIAYYNQLFTVLNINKLEAVITGLESDEKFGPIEEWDSDTRHRAYIQLNPFFEKVHAIEKALAPIEA